ncbi:MAG: phasin family protein [Bryobacteraceae bacterium]|jgi:poly(hydroxyalkanoate) granule-associated protein
MATTPSEEPSQPKPQPGPAEERPTVLHDLWLASLGVAAVTAEQAGRLLGTLVRKGREVEPRMAEHGRHAANDARKLVADMAAELQDLREKIGRAAASAEAAIDEKISARVRQMGLTRRQEIEQLKAKIEELTARMEELSKKSGQPPKPE